MTNTVENYLNKNMLTVEAQEKINQQIIKESKNALQGITGMDVSDYDAMVERAIKHTQDEIDKLSNEQIDEILGQKAVAFIDKHIKVTLAKKMEYKRDYIKLIIEQDEFDRGIEGARDTLNQQNQEFTDQLNQLISEMKKSTVPYTQHLVDTINNPESTPEEIYTAKEMIRAINYVNNLEFLATRNNKRLVKLINNDKEYARIKNKAIKLINRDNYGIPVEFNTLELKLMELMNLDADLKKIDEKLKVKIILIITTKFYIQVSKTKRLDTFTKTFILYFKTYVLSVGTNTTIEGAPEFLTALEQYIKNLAKIK